MLQYDEYKIKLNNIRPSLDELDAALNLDAAKREAEMLESESASEGFWDNIERAQKTQLKLSKLKSKIEKQEARKSHWEDLFTICEMGNEEEDDSMLEELEQGYDQLVKEIEEARLQTLLTGEYDNNDCILTIHAGAGGTEAQDWASMMFRMYQHWADANGFKCETVDYEDGDEAGIKAATIMISGENAYGYLKGEHGVHRLVRVSPFDSNARRHTSFAAVEVMPDLPDDIEVDIREEDIEMQVFRCSGAGGQHINKTSSGVRLIHHPTGVVVSSTQERSQFQNKDTCYRMLRDKLVQMQLQAKAETINDLKGVQLKIEWGSQIRSYVFMPYQMVKDMRTGFETSAIDHVMDGDLNGFINAYLTCAATGNWVTK